MIMNTSVPLSWEIGNDYELDCIFKLGEWEAVDDKGELCARTDLL